MLRKTSEGLGLSGTELDFWVAKAVGLKHVKYADSSNDRCYFGLPECGYFAGTRYTPSIDCRQAEPIIKEKRITVWLCVEGSHEGLWQATIEHPVKSVAFGATPLVAAMRVFVSSVFSGCLVGTTYRESLKQSHLSESVKKARTFALTAHSDHLCGSMPYSYYLDQVAEIAEIYGETAVVVAYLHDIVERTTIKESDVLSIFGSEVSMLVGILADESGHTLAEIKLKNYIKMKNVSKDGDLALVIKAASRLTNVRMSTANRGFDTLKAYRSDHFSLRSAVYRPGLCEEIWSEIDMLLGVSENGCVPAPSASHNCSLQVHVQ